MARNVLAQETEATHLPEAGAHAAVLAAEKLRLHLTRLVGVAGYHALLARALSLAKAEASWLGAFVERASQQDAQVALEGEIALLSQLLGLLVTFIGEALTLRLVRDIWPEASLNAGNTGTEETLS
jgi:hypothetical protein